MSSLLPPHFLICPEPPNFFFLHDITPLRVKAASRRLVVVGMVLVLLYGRCRLKIGVSFVVVVRAEQGR